MVELGPHCDSLAPRTCALVRQLRGGQGDRRRRGGAEAADHRNWQERGGLGGVGYYMLRPGTVLHAHARPVGSGGKRALLVREEGALWVCEGGEHICSIAFTDRGHGASA